MKLALDPQMFYATHAVHELPDVVAKMGSRSPSTSAWRR
jgi:myo-inositol catabolism protein IolH